MKRATRNRARLARQAFEQKIRELGQLLKLSADVKSSRVHEEAPPGELDPEAIVTPGIFVDRVVSIANPAHESELVEAGASYP